MHDIDKEEFVAPARSRAIYSIQSNLENGELTGQPAMNDPVLNQKILFQPAMGFLFSSAATVLGADRMTFSGFRKPGGTISIDGPPKIWRIGRIVGEEPWRRSSARAQAAILKWNCGICNFGSRSFS